ncbi:MAG: NUDIX hydrolase [Gammaproteobacteria bacterium]|nr:NUDIX hydrolase [Gammaproteobacteria bacterium]
MLPTDLTVSAVVENDGQFLIVEERSSGTIVLNQPGGHIEAGESPEQAAERETLEEAGCVISVTGLLAVYLWIHPQTRQNFLRITYVADLLSQDIKRDLDDGIHAVHWFTRSDLVSRSRDVRTPMVLRAIDDYLAGKREPASKLEALMPVQNHVHEVLAGADLV